MDLIEYEKITRSEAAALKYVLGFCWKGSARYCPKCTEPRVYNLAEGRMRCGRCRYTFHDLSRRWINFGGLSCQDWLRLVKLFELELTVSRMAPQLRLSYNTVYKAVTALRFSLLAQALDSRQLLSGAFGLDLGFSGGRIAMERPGDRQGAIPVFGLMEKNGWAFVDLLPHVQAEHVLHFHLNFKLRLLRMGNVVYTDRYRHYDALIFCADDSLPLQYLPLRERGERGTYVDSQKGGFWVFAKARLRRFNGVSSRRFPLYLKELEFRFNHRTEDLFPRFVQSLCSLVPDLE